MHRLAGAQQSLSGAQPTTSATTRRYVTFRNAVFEQSWHIASPDLFWDGNTARMLYLASSAQCIYWAFLFYYYCSGTACKEEAVKLPLLYCHLAMRACHHAGLCVQGEDPRRLRRLHLLQDRRGEPEQGEEAAGKEERGHHCPPEGAVRRALCIPCAFLMI